MFSLTHLFTHSLTHPRSPPGATTGGPANATGLPRGRPLRDHRCASPHGGLGGTHHPPPRRRVVGPYCYQAACRRIGAYGAHHEPPSHLKSDDRTSVGGFSYTRRQHARHDGQVPHARQTRGGPSLSELLEGVPQEGSLSTHCRYKHPFAHGVASGALRLRRSPSTPLPSDTATQTGRTTRTAAAALLVSCSCCVEGLSRGRPSFNRA